MNRAFSVQNALLGPRTQGRLPRAGMKQAFGLNGAAPNPQMHPSGARTASPCVIAAPPAGGCLTERAH